VKLIIQPDDGVSPLIAAIKNAKKRIDVAIFRFDHGQLEKALKDAVARGVRVNALIASVNHGGEKSLRKLEMRFLEAGITVARTASELIRYHDKIMVIDHQTLCVLSFNVIHLDIDHSRGFGIVTSNTKWVGEGVKLLDADFKRTPYAGGLDTFVVSPTNARKTLATFLKRAKKQLLIYDPKISDKKARQSSPAYPHHHPRRKPGVRWQPEPSHRRTGLASRSRPDNSRREDCKEIARHI
jgi:cardiolipin synthase